MEVSVYDSRGKEGVGDLLLKRKVGHRKSSLHYQRLSLRRQHGDTCIADVDSTDSRWPGIKTDTGGIYSPLRVRVDMSFVQRFADCQLIASYRPLRGIPGAHRRRGMLERAIAMPSDKWTDKPGRGNVSVSLAYPEAIARRCYVYELTAQGATHGGEHGYVAFLGDPFGLEVISGNLIPNTTPAPEPATWVLSMVGLGCIIGVLGQRRGAPSSSICFGGP